MNEKVQFSQRLTLALKRAGITAVSPTKLAISFNLHHQGKPISTQAAHRWLNGTAIPSQDKIRTLSGWLNVAPEWLRYGGDTEVWDATKDLPPRYSEEEQLLTYFRQLDEQQQHLAKELIATMFEVSKRNSRSTKN